MENGILLQGFHWYTPKGGTHWKWLKSQLPEFKKAGFTAIWIPPPGKCDPSHDEGYAPYDRWDLGKYNQKGQVNTRYGSEQDLRDLCSEAKNFEIGIYVDAVFNHMAAADKTEWVKAIVVSRENRNNEVGEWIDIQAWTRFEFAERMKDPEGKRRSDKIWTADDFEAVDFAENLRDWGLTIFKLKGKRFQNAVSNENGNFDYLCYADIDMDSASAKDDLKRWGTWMLREIRADGFRFDGLKHIRSYFFREFINHIKAHYPDHFSVGEYWETNTKPLHEFISDTQGMISLFDVPLQTKFHQASAAVPRNSFDMRNLISGTLSAEQPALSVTFVENHDTMPCQKLEQSVEPWFKPWAYAFILLRQQGYPTIFLPDWTGAEYTDNNRHVVLNSHDWILRRLMATRIHCAWGSQQDYFDHPNTVGWIRYGNDHHAGLAGLINNGSQDGWKWMHTGKPDMAYTDILEQRKETITTNTEGWANFTVNPESCSVWVQADALPWIREKISR